MDVERLLQKIPARYTVLGTIDGVVGSLATVMGLSAVNASSALIVTAGLSVGVGLGISNGFGGFMAERTVEQMKMRKLETAMLQKKGSLKKTKIGKNVWKKLLIDTLTHGGFSFLGAVVPVIPFILLATVNLGAIFSFFLGIITLFFLGMYSGYMTKENMIRSGIAMLLVGILVTVITRAFEFGH
ncbi:MAG: VIT1/CCC1 transporter family protein [Thermoplasmata archaeon]|nr:VIT1/CCC1 transporter family protein [Thermoplasmata archaeon]